ncbi:MAG: hypothetical protein ACMUIE_07610 [Thermoplasmatota archaeon]
MTSEEAQKILEKANIQLASGEYQKSFNTLKKLVGGEPDVAEAYFGMAEAAVGIPKLKIQDIASYYQKACDLSPDNALYFATYGNFCFESGILKKGEECFLRAAEIDEENSALYLSDLATTYYFSARNFKHMYPKMTDDEILQTSLKYIMMAFNINKDQAVSLISKLD